MKGNNTIPGFVSTQIGVFLVSYFISTLVCEIFLSLLYPQRENSEYFFKKMLLENVGGMFKVVYLRLDIENVYLDLKKEDIQMKNT